MHRDASYSSFTVLVRYWLILYVLAYCYNNMFMLVIGLGLKVLTYKLTVAYAVIPRVTLLSIDLQQYYCYNNMFMLVFLRGDVTS